MASGYRPLLRYDPDEAGRLAALAQHAVDLRWETYEEMAARSAQVPPDARPGVERAYRVRATTGADSSASGAGRVTA